MQRHYRIIKVALPAFQSRPASSNRPNWNGEPHHNRSPCKTGLWAVSPTACWRISPRPSSLPECHIAADLRHCHPGTGQWL